MEDGSGVGRADRQREVRASSHQVALQQAHEALDRGHPGAYDSRDAFNAMFPPSSPLGPDDTEDDTSMTGPGHFTPARPRSVSDQQKRASATDDDWAAVDEFEQYRDAFRLPTLTKPMAGTVTASTPAPMSR